MNGYCCCFCACMGKSERQDIVRRLVTADYGYLVSVLYRNISKGGCGKVGREIWCSKLSYQSSQPPCLIFAMPTYLIDSYRVLLQLGIHHTQCWIWNRLNWWKGKRADRHDTTHRQFGWPGSGENRLTVDLNRGRQRLHERESR
jgi:hypothetical protein